MTGPPGDLPADLSTALRALAARRPVLVALDFDGVLAPIVARPEDARALPAAHAAVVRLATVPRVHVALVSGRHLESLRVVADPPPGVVLVASHGAEVEGSPPPEVPTETLQAVRGALTAVAANRPGATVEHKPTAAVLHTRGAAPDVGAAATQDALAAVAEIAGAHVMLGKQVVEVSVVRADKGTAVRDLRARLGVEAVLYAGDDVTDEDVLSTLDPATDVGVKVGDGDTAAAFRVADPAAVAVVLTRLADSFDGSG